MALFLTSSLVVVLAVTLSGRDLVVEDPDIFEAAGIVASYADERLRAAALGERLPDPPRVLADTGTLRIAFGFTIVFQALTMMAIVIIVRRKPGELVRLFRLDRFESRQMVRPAIATFAAYLGVIAYAVAMEAFGVDILVPEGTVPTAVARDSLALALAGIAAVIMAPLSEEFLYRGLIMGGLLKWGFLPAAVISSVLFSAVHLDIGSLIPFFGIGLVLAWLYWSGGRLWDAIIFHFLFNLVSYLILVGTGG
jgi:uncharacterized protein